MLNFPLESATHYCRRCGIEVTVKKSEREPRCSGCNETLLSVEVDAELAHELGVSNPDAEF